MRDYDYMLECSRRPRDPFLATGERKVDRYVTRKIIRKIVGGDCIEDIDIDELGIWEEIPLPIGDTRGNVISNAWRKGFLDRLLLAAVGAFLLLGPMWLMVLHNSMFNPVSASIS
jgi:hypothetical protein